MLFTKQIKPLPKVSCTCKFYNDTIYNFTVFVSHFILNKNVADVKKQTLENKILNYHKNVIENIFSQFYLFSGQCLNLMNLSRALNHPKTGLNLKKLNTILSGIKNI